jgi:hypothetical protein
VCQALGSLEPACSKAPDQTFVMSGRVRFDG